jgi:hypothetical protein
MLLAKDGPAFFIGDHAATSASFRIRADASASVVASRRVKETRSTMA